MAEQALPATVQELSDEMSARYGLEAKDAMSQVLDKLAEIGYVNFAPSDPVIPTDASQILATADWKRMDSV